MNDVNAKQLEKDDAEFREIVTQRYMYNAELCQGTPLVGYLINRLPMPPIKNRHWDAFLIRTTRPTQAVDREKEVVDVPVGSEVLIPATYTLSQFLSKAASSDRFVYEVRIEPDKKIDIGGSQSMWQYKLAAKPTPSDRRTFGLSAVLGAPQLTAGTSSEAKDSDIPF